MLVLRAILDQLKRVRQIMTLRRLLPKHQGDGQEKRRDQTTEHDHGAMINPSPIK